MRVVSAIMFYPRGGSSHATRALAGGLRANGWDVTLVAGSLPISGPHADARRFYGPEIQAVDFGPALASGDPLRYDGPPMHPSYEDRPGAPDRVFASLDDLEYERQVQAWCEQLTHAGAANADALHLHHLTPINEAAARVAPHVPVVGQLHGTELLMLEKIDAGANWPYGERWAARMRAWAQRCTRIVVVPAGVERALKLLPVSRERLAPLPNGVDVEVFDRRDVDRGAFWRRVLNDEPAAEGMATGTVFLYVGRFMAVKRLDLLIEAYTRAREHVRAGLVLVGGHPGECEGEHPAELARRFGAPDVFLAGWQDQAALPEFFSAADAVVLSSEHEQFGQVLVEGMACGLPAIAPRWLGPASIIDDGETGWLVEPNDVSALAGALREAIDDPRERTRRGGQAWHSVRRQFAWTSIAAQLSEVLRDAVSYVRTELALRAADASL